MKPGRATLLILVGYMLTVLQASVQALIPIRVLVPELGLLVAVYAGLQARDGVAGACAVALAVGYVTDLLAGAPKGLHALVFVLLCLMAKGASLRLLLRGAAVTAVFTFTCSLVGAILVVLVRSETEGGGWGPLAIAPIQAAVTALFAPLVYAFLSRIEGRARPNERAAGLGL